jgi:hypothetical protein
VPTEQIVVYGVVLIPERGKRSRRFEWRTHLGVLPATLAAALSRAADARAAAEAAAALAQAAAPAVEHVPATPEVVHLRRTDGTLSGVFIEKPAPRAERITEEYATLKLGVICERLGFTVSAAFLADTLHIRPAKAEGASKLYTETQFRTICRQLQSHVGAMAELYAAEVVS